MRASRGRIVGMGGAPGRTPWVAGLAVRAAGVAVLLLGCGNVIGPSGADRTLWRVSGRGFGVPAFDAERAYFMSWQHELVVVDKQSGAQRWTRRTAASAENTSGFNLVIAGDVVVMPDAALYAFDRVTGEPRWTFAPAGDPPGAGFIATDGQTIYAGSFAGRVYAVDASTGTQRWMTQVGQTDAILLRPTVREGAVYVGLKRLTVPNSGMVAALDAATGAVRWRVDVAATDPGLPSGVAGPLAFYRDLALVSVQDGSIRALDRATGETRWTAPRLSGLPSGTGGSPDNDDRPLVVVGDLVIAGSTTGWLVGLDARTGAERWRATANRGSAVFPLSSDGAMVFVTHLGGQLAAVRASSGAVAWYAGDNRTGIGEFSMTPAIDGGRLYIAGRNGYYALRKD